MGAVVVHQPAEKVLDRAGGQYRHDESLHFGGVELVPLVCAFVSNCKGDAEVELVLDYASILCDC